MLDLTKAKITTKADKEAQALEQKKAEARQHLADTDWYYTREIETGKPVPDSVKNSRVAARVTLEEGLS